MGRKLGAVSFLEILAPELNDRILADMLDLETGVIVNLHIKSIDQSEAIKTIKRKITAVSYTHLWTATYFQSKGDPITDLHEDMAADGTTA